LPAAPRRLETEQSLKHQKNQDLNDRRNGAAAARKALLDNYRTARETGAAALAEKLAEREAIAAARDERRAERDRVKAEERDRERLAEEARLAEIAAAARQETEAREAAENERIARVVGDEATRKAERDRRYAARKARQR
jgi:hypothetical protein